MPPSLDDLLAAFHRSSPRPAVFDPTLRKRAGVWKLSEPLPVETVVDRFATHGGFATADGGVAVPIHEPHAPAPTGAFLVYRRDRSMACVEYVDFARSGWVRVPLDTVSGLYPAWRLRYWHPELVETADQARTGGFPPVGQDGTATEPGPSEPATPLDPDDLFEALRESLLEARAVDRSAASEAFARLPFSEYANEYGGIRRLSGGGLDVDQFGQQVATFRRPADGPSADVGAVDWLRAGTEVVVDCETATAGFPLEATVLSVDGRTIEVGVYWDRTEEKTAAESVLADGADNTFRIGALVDPTPTDRLIEAIDAVAADERKTRMLTGQGDPTDEAARAVDVPAAGLDRTQRRAAERAVHTRTVHCIHGPPATGKTRTAVRIIRAAVAAGLKVLASAPPGGPIRDLLVGASRGDHVDSRSLHGLATGRDVTVAYLGDAAGGDPVPDRYTDVPEWRADVVCGSPTAIASVTEGVFDLAVVDGASQLTVPASLVPFANADALVLAGDHRGLPPGTAGERSRGPPGADSLFEHLIRLYDGVSTMLTTQYRMHRAIAAFPNAEFYDGALEHGTDNRSWTIGDRAPLQAYQIAGEEQSTAAGSYANEAEAAVVGREVSALLHAGVSPSDIGIIAPSSGQVGVIRRELVDLDDPDVAAIDVGTVESLEGTAREAVVVSFVRSNTEGETGVLADPDYGPRWLNVAMTRARKRCVLVGDFTTLATRSPDRGPEESAAPVYGRLRDHLEAEGAIEEWTG